MQNTIEPAAIKEKEEDDDDVHQLTKIMITLCITRLLRRRAPCIVTQHLLDCTMLHYSVLCCYTILSYSTIERTL